MVGHAVKTPTQLLSAAKVTDWCYGLQVAFGPVARELVVYRHKAPNCSFHGEPPAGWAPPNTGSFDRCSSALDVLPGIWQQ
jgi:hypothetical protein